MLNLRHCVNRMFKIFIPFGTAELTLSHEYLLLFITPFCVCRFYWYNFLTIQYTQFFAASLKRAAIRIYSILHSIRYSKPYKSNLYQYLDNLILNS